MSPRGLSAIQPRSFMRLDQSFALQRRWLLCIDLPTIHMDMHPAAITTMTAGMTGDMDMDRAILARMTTIATVAKQFLVYGARLCKPPSAGTN
jgi:hypothetical protein